MRARQVWAAVGALVLAKTVWAQAEPVSDPIEPVNRVVFGFNNRLDRYLMKPVAQGYVAAVPTSARVGVSNFFGNFGDVPTAFNNLLQGKVGAAASDVGRILVNSTVGILGFIDVASEVGLNKHKEDFGLTLGHWGVGAGPYMVLPLLGPSTLRDTVALPVDYAVGVQRAVTQEVAVRNAMTGLQLVSVRADLLGLDQTLEEAALGDDTYALVRSLYVQRRNNLVNGGAPPRHDDDLDDPESPHNQAKSAPLAPATAPTPESSPEKKESP